MWRKPQRGFCLSLAAKQPAGSHLKTATGCRPAQMFGAWAIEPTRFAAMFEVARKADLNALAAAMQAANGSSGGRSGASYQLTQGGTALIELVGPMTKYQSSFQSMFGGASTLATRNALRAAVRDPEVRSILLIADSPGGSVAGTQELASDIRAAGKKKPVHAYVDDLAASAALWAISGVSRISANEAAEIGSIGCYFVVYDTSGFYAQEGVKVHVISSAPPHKGAGAEGSEVSEEQLAEWKRTVDGIAALFTADLAKGRKMPIAKARELADGRIHLAAAAKDMGLIDGIGSLDEAVRTLEKTKAMKNPTDDTGARADDELPPEEPQPDKDKEAMQARLAELEASNKASAAQLEKLLAENREKDVKASIAAGMSKIPGLTSATLIAIAAAVPAAIYQALETSLKGANELITKGAAFAEIGTTKGGAPGSAMQQLEAKADELRAKDPKLTRAQAILSASEQNPDLVKEARAEKKGA